MVLADTQFHTIVCYSEFTIKNSCVLSDCIIIVAHYSDTTGTTHKFPYDFLGGLQAISVYLLNMATYLHSTSFDYIIH